MKTLIVEVKYPDQVSNADIKEYVKEAIEMWGGQRHPEDELFYTTKAPKSRMRAKP